MQSHKSTLIVCNEDLSEQLTQYTVAVHSVGGVSTHHTCHSHGECSGGRVV